MQELQHIVKKAACQILPCQVMLRYANEELRKSSARAFEECGGRHFEVN